MKIRLYWPNCKLIINNVDFHGEDAFFLECSIDEAREHLFDQLTEDQIKLCLHNFESQTYFGQHEYNTETNKICFLITRNQKVILPVSWYFPYAGQWNAYNPFLRTREIELKNIGELSEMLLEVEQK